LKNTGGEKEKQERKSNGEKGDMILGIRRKLVVKDEENKKRVERIMVK